MQVRAEYTKLGMIRYISHLDLVRLFERAIERAKIPVIYSEGFNPHPKFTLGNPLSLGVESQSEFMDIQVEDGYPLEEMKNRLNRELPQGVAIKEVFADFDKRAIQQRIQACLYAFDLGEDKLDLAQAFKKMDKLMIQRRRKKGRKKILVEEDAYDLVEEIWQEGPILYGRFSSKEGATLRPDLFLKAMKESLGLDWDMDEIGVKRVTNYDENGQVFHGR